MTAALCRQMIHQMTAFGADRKQVRAALEKAADEIEHLALDLQTERAAVVALKAELERATHSCTGPTPNCRTCSHYRHSDRVDCCADICTNADRYDPLPPVRLWRVT